MEDFDTLADVRKEQQLRRRRLRVAARRHANALDARAARLLGKQLRWVKRRCRQRCSSPVYVRDQCRRVAGALLKFIEGAGKREALAAFHIWTISGRIEPHELAKISAAALLNRMRSAILRAAKQNGHASGWLILFIDGESEPYSGTIRLHFHGVGSGGLIDAIDGPLRKMADFSLPRAIRVDRYVQSPVRAITYMMKRYWKSVPRSPGENALRARRIPEPIHSQVLLWLDQYELADLCLKIGLRVDGNGDFRRT